MVIRMSKRKEVKVKIAIVPVPDPYGCCECILVNEKDNTCIIDNKERRHIKESGKPEWCPLWTMEQLKEELNKRRNENV